MENAHRPLPEIVVHANSDSFYWGLVPREEMRQFVALAERTSFEEARAGFSFSLPFDYADNFDRADFHLFLPIPADAAVLDLGSGFGNVTIPLSQYYKEVTAVDASKELLQISRIRARDAGRTNIRFVQVDPLGSTPLPFADASYDAVCLNGVLEWVGLSDAEKNPRHIQEFLLSEVVRVLKPGGVLYVGIENRWFPGWWSRDPHSKLAYTAFMPRALADWYARRNGLPEGYRTYVYGYRSYLRLFRRYFTLEQTLLPYSSYRYPEVIYPHTRQISRYLFSYGYGKKIYTRKWFYFLRILHLFGLEHYFLAAFMFVLRKGAGSHTSAIERILTASSPETYHSTDTLLKIRSKNTLKLLAIRRGEQRVYGIYEISRGPAGILRDVRFVSKVT